MVNNFNITILDPVQESSAEVCELAPRLNTLDGKTIGFFNNAKLNSSELLKSVSEIIHESFALKQTVFGPDLAGKLLLHPDPELKSGFQFGLTLAGIKGCDAIILANGD